MIYTFQILLKKTKNNFVTAHICESFHFLKHYLSFYFSNHRMFNRLLDINYDPEYNACK